MNLTGEEQLYVVMNGEGQASLRVADISTFIEHQPAFHHPITKVNGKQGEVTLTASDVGALGSNANATSATKLSTARLFSITEGVTAAPVNFDGSSHVVLKVTTVDASKLSGAIPVASLPTASASTVGMVKQAVAQPDSKATEAAGLVTEFNALLAKLRIAGILAP